MVESKFNEMDAKIGIVDTLNNKIDTRRQNFEKTLVQCNAVCSIVDQLTTAVDNISVAQLSIF